MKLASFLVLAALSGMACAQPYPASRTGLQEYSLQPFLIGSRTYDFADGARAKLDGGAGIGLAFTHHLNDYFAIGIEGSVASIDYRARIVPARGNPGAPEDASGTMERGTLHFVGTWHLLAGRTTPLLTAGAGFTHLDPDIESAPPGGGCWNYPWWGRFCGTQPPTHGMTRFSYALGAGLRHDLPAGRGFLRFVVNGEWIDWRGDPDRLSSVGVRADFGARF